LVQNQAIFDAALLCTGYEIERVDAANVGLTVVELDLESFGRPG
jgi:hypothetical protein